MIIGLDKLDINLSTDLISFLNNAIQSFITHDKKDIIAMLQDGYKIADHFQNFPEETDKLILETVIPNFVENILSDKPIRNV